MKMSAINAIRAADTAAESLTVTLPQAPRLRLNVIDESGFEYDPSQIAAIELMRNQQFACLTGAAGTGKTTVTQKLVDVLAEDVELIDVQRGDGIDSHKRIPSICLCAFTGIAVQQIMKRFDASWHPNIMTIHRMLEFKPVFEEVPDSDNPGEMKTIKRFYPTRDKSNPLDYKIIIIDEAGMLGSDLWHQILDACRPTTRIYMIGDINQLQPIIGDCVFGVAMSRWPTAELTKVWRQEGAETLPILDAAHAILKGRTPRFIGSFAGHRISDNPLKAAMDVRKVIRHLQDRGIYDPFRDAVITATNGFEQGKPGYELGQQPLNESVCHRNNPDGVRYRIDGGRVQQELAIGDRVMVTENDYDKGVVNGMLGVITDITRNQAYQGDENMYGPLEEVRTYLTSQARQFESRMSVPDMDFEAQLAAAFETRGTARAEAERGLASHSIHVTFDDQTEAVFSTKSEVANLRLGYFFTCHKTQGSEFPFVTTIVHPTYGRLLTREWLYTAVTRARSKALLLYTPQGLACALNKQAIPGKSLAEKMAWFRAQNVQTIRIPEPREVK